MKSILSLMIESQRPACCGPLWQPKSLYHDDLDYGAEREGLIRFAHPAPLGSSHSSSSKCPPGTFSNPPFGFSSLHLPIRISCNKKSSRFSGSFPDLSGEGGIDSLRSPCSAGLLAQLVVEMSPRDIFEPSFRVLIPPPPVPHFL